MNRLLITTLAAALAAGTTGAFAAKPTDTTQADQYNHGQAVREAAQRDMTGKPDLPPGQTVRETAHTQRDFMQFDADKNGTLSAAELEADADITSNFGTLDEDGDGILSRTEFNGHLELDDDDGDLVEDEE